MKQIDSLVLRFVMGAALMGTTQRLAACIWARPGQELTVRTLVRARERQK